MTQKLIDEDGVDVTARSTAASPAAAGCAEKVELRETMWAEMKPDLYAGKTCDKQRARWDVYASGDKQDETTSGNIVLDPKMFPPGTKVVVSEPCCPQCGDVREMVYPAPKVGPRFEPKCDCGFDWEAWVGDQYS